MTDTGEVFSTELTPVSGDRTSGLGRIRTFRHLREYVLVLMVVVSWLILNFLTDGIFLSPRNLGTLGVQSAITAMAAMSAVVLMVSLNFDLSTGSAAALVSVIVAILTVNMGLDPLIAVAGALITGLILGFWNGFWVAYVGVPAFIVTLASMLALRGAAFVMTNASTIGPVPAFMTDFAGGRLAPSYSIALVVVGLTAYSLFQILNARQAAALGLLDRPMIEAARRLVPAVLFAIPAVWLAWDTGIPNLLVLLAILVIIFEVMMRGTVFGARIYAIGGNREAATLAGIRVQRETLYTFLVAGVMYGVIGWVLTARLSAAVPGSAGIGLEFEAITAAVIGGTSLFGGKGTILGALVGALFVGGLINGMSLLNVNIYYQNIIRGLLLLAVVAVDVVSRRPDVFSGLLRRRLSLRQARESLRR